MLQLKYNNGEEFIYLKATKLKESIMLQIIDISPQVLLDKQKNHSKFLTIINATVSHELRNPLNSIIALNLEKDELYNTLGALLNSSVLDPRLIITKAKFIHSKLLVG